MGKPRLEMLVEKFDKAYKLIKNFSNNQGWEKQYLKEAMARLDEIRADMANQDEEKQAETIRVFFERRIKVPQKHKGVIKTLCNLNPEFHQAMQDIHDCEIFQEKNNKHLQDVLGKGLITKSAKAKSAA